MIELPVSPCGHQLKRPTTVQRMKRQCGDCIPNSLMLGRPQARPSWLLHPIIASWAPLKMVHGFQDTTLVARASPAPAVTFQTCTLRAPAVRRMTATQGLNCQNWSVVFWPSPIGGASLESRTLTPTSSLLQNSRSQKIYIRRDYMECQNSSLIHICPYHKNPKPYIFFAFLYNSIYKHTHC